MINSSNLWRFIFSGKIFRKLPPADRHGKDGAGNEIRTRDTKLGKLVLYQLSYARSKIYLATVSNKIKIVNMKNQSKAGTTFGELVKNSFVSETGKVLGPVREQKEGGRDLFVKHVPDGAEFCTNLLYQRIPCIPGSM